MKRVAGECQMMQRKLRNELLTMVREHGIEHVQQQLNEIRLSVRRREGDNHDSGRNTSKPIRQRRPKPTAIQYVEKMTIPREKAAGLAEVAERFDAKTFLPSFGDIRNFCESHGVDVPAYQSRASAIPRVFKQIATLEAADVQRIIKEGHFSGPSRLGPIADAIRRNGRVAAAEDAARNNST